MDNTFQPPPGRKQLTLGDTVRMSLASLRLHATASWLQGLTIAATAAFLVFVAGEIIAVRLTRGLPTAEANPEEKIVQLVWILAVSLLVCVISNVISMLFSVSKRFREIGTMKCLGAFDQSILTLFLVEAALLGGAGAFTGALAGSALAAGSLLATHGAMALTGVFCAQLGLAAAAAFAIVTAMSFLGAAYPSWQASRMLPIEAMRSV